MGVRHRRRPGAPCSQHAGDEVAPRGRPPPLNPTAESLMHSLKGCITAFQVETATSKRGGRPAAVDRFLLDLSEGCMRSSPAAAAMGSSEFVMCMGAADYKDLQAAIHVSAEPAALSVASRLHSSFDGSVVITHRSCDSHHSQLPSCTSL
jgi:hypothetical protein